MDIEQEGLQPATVITAQNLRVDALTVEVVEATRRAGVEPIVLKGPSIRHSLGPDLVRPYVDCDLLVAPSERERVEAVLRSLGFQRYLENVELGERWRHPAVGWGRADEAFVDLHHGLDGAEASGGALLDLLTPHTARMSLGRTAVTILDPVGIAVTLALHAAQHGKEGVKPLADLSAALSRLSAQTWAEAARLAAELGALPAFAAGLRLVPAGREVAESLALPAETPTAVALAADSAPPAAFTLEHVASKPGIRAKAVFVAGRLFPPADFVRDGYPFARRGPAALVATYAARLVVAPLRLLHALPTWRRARNAARASRRTG